MDIFFQDPSEIPLPPDEVHIRDLKVTPGADNKRVKVAIEIEPFQIRPNIELVIVNSANENLSSVSIVECVTRKMDLTMHLSGDVTDGIYTLLATIYYFDRSLPQADEELIIPERMIIDTKEKNFHLSK